MEKEEHLMADDLDDVGGRDDARIDVHQDYELRYWSKAFGVSPDELRSAVAKAGPMVKHVREHLQHRA
jgi:hypothetical protein